MKRVFSLLMAFAIMVTLCACQGNFGSVDLNDSIAIPEDGIIKESLIDQIKNKNAIGVFTGTSGDYKYEWTIFGSDIAQPKEINLLVEISKIEDGGIQSLFAHAEPFGFPALLSIYLDEEWDAQSATVYKKETAVASVSITGSKSTILNLYTDGSLGEVVIRPDELPEDAIIASDAATQTSGNTDNYLSDVKDSDDRVYSDNAGSKTPIAAPSAPGQETDGYLSAVTGSSSQVYSDGSTVNVQTSTPSEETTRPAVQNDNYLSDVKDSDDKVYIGKDKYYTDPVPTGKPQPVEPEDQDVNKGQSYTCTFSIECSTILNNLDQLDPDKLEMVPSGGLILKKATVTFYEGESVYDVLQRVCKNNGIHMEASWTPIYNSAYVEGIHNLYEFDCGALSGWMYKVNGWYPNYGSSRYQLKEGDSVEWRYTCDLGNDIGGGYAVGG